METKKPVIATLIAVISLLHITCNEGANCSICPAVVSGVFMSVRYDDGSIVALDSFKTLRKSDGLRVKTPLTDNDSATSRSSGSYVVFYSNNPLEPKLNHSGAYIFIGYKNGIAIVNNEVVISKACCQINLLSGQTIVTLNK